MIYPHTLVKLTLLVMAALILLQSTAAPLPTTRSAPPVTPLVMPHAAIPPASGVVRDFMVFAPVGRAALDPRAEVLFDN